jgi:hypothetical protein
MHDSYPQTLVRLTATLSLLAACASAQATVYVNGTSELLSSHPAGAVELGTHLPSYIGPTVNEGNGTALDGTRVYFYDVNDPAGLAGASAMANLNLLVWQFTAPKDTVRLYTHQDHYSGGPIGNALAPEVLEYSIFGCNSGNVANRCKTAANWTMLSDPVSWVLDGTNPVYTFSGTPAAAIFRAGSAEFGVVNAYVQDYTFGAQYDFFAIRGSSIAMQANTADPELDAMAAFNRKDVPEIPGDVPVPGIPEPETYVLMLAGLVAVGLAARRRRA